MQARAGRAGLFYEFIVRFSLKHDGTPVEKPIVASTTSFPNRQIGKTFFVYYNDKHPKHVARKGLHGDFFSTFWIATGIIILFI